MKILSPHKYIDLETETEPFLKLCQISRWDLTPAHCFKETGEHTLSYVLRQYTRKGGAIWEAKVVEKLTAEMVEELGKMGYIIPEKLK